MARYRTLGSSSRTSGFEVVVDDHGLTEHLHVFTRRELDKARRRGLTEAAKKTRSLARAAAPIQKEASKNRKPGSVRRAISYSTRSRRGFMFMRVFIKGEVGGYHSFYGRFIARGTNTRETSRGFNRGRVEAVPFMQEAADYIDPRVRGFIDDEVRKALRISRLR